MRTRSFTLAHTLITRLGGGGNSATRKSKIEAKNHELDVKRKKAYAAKGSTDGEQSVAGGHGDGHDVAAGAVSAPHKKGKLRVDGDVAFNARILASGPNSVAVAKKRKSASTHAPPAAASTTKKQRTAPSYETPQK